MYKSTVSKVDFEYFRSGRRVLRHRYYSSTLFVLTVALHIKHSVKSFFCNMDFHLYSVRQTRDYHVWSREVRSELCCVFWKNIFFFIVSIKWIKRGGDINNKKTLLSSSQHNVWLHTRYALSIDVQTVTVFGRTYATSSLVNDQSSVQSAYTMAAFVDLVSQFDYAPTAFVFLVQGCARRTHAFSFIIPHVAFINWTFWNWNTINTDVMILLQRRNTMTKHLDKGLAKVIVVTYLIHGKIVNESLDFRYIPAIILVVN